MDSPTSPGDPVVLPNAHSALINNKLDEFLNSFTRVNIQFRPDNKNYLTHCVNSIKLRNSKVGRHCSSSKSTISIFRANRVAILYYT